MAWIEYHTALRDHWKIKRLADYLGVDYPTALGAISCLWLWCAEYAPTGDLRRFTDDEIRFAARLPLEKFQKNTLQACCLLTEGQFINDWGKHGLKLLESKRKANREYAKRKRDSGYPLDTERVAIPNQPNHTIPNQYKYIGDEGFSRVFEDYLEMRKKLRKPATDKAQELVLKELHKYPIETAVKMLEQSIVNSWRGVFPLKDQQKFSQGSPSVSFLTDEVIEKTLGKMATKLMIKKFLTGLPQPLWARVSFFLRKRYPEDGDRVFMEAERELIKEAKEYQQQVSKLTEGIGNEHI